MTHSKKILVPGETPDAPFEYRLVSIFDHDNTPRDMRFRTIRNVTSIGEGLEKAKANIGPLDPIIIAAPTGLTHLSFICSATATKNS